jgi:HEAT repeat protein
MKPMKPHLVGACALLCLSFLPLLEAHEAREAPARVDPTAAPIRPGPDRDHDVMESAFCAGCHPAIYAEHEQSTHGRAFTDPEVRLATARFDLNDCIVCHTPRPIFETGVGQNPMRRHYGLEEGNTCMTCHWQPDYDYASFEGGSECRQAFHPEVGTVESCASCHRNHGTPYQWEKSPTGKATLRVCMDCHMETVLRPVAVGGPIREVRTHVFPGSRSQSQVRRAYRYAARVDGNAVVVTVENKGAGHNFPTELKQRSVESLVVVRDANGTEVARSRMVFRDPYKRPYGLELPVNTQIPGGQTRTHRVPIPVANGTVETTLFFKLYYPIEDYHPELSRVLESRSLPFAGIAPSAEPIESEPEVHAVTPEGISPEETSPANLVDYAHPPIGTVEVDVPEGDSPEDIARLIDLFQFPVPAANGAARKRLQAIGMPAVPALIEALGSWDNKTYNQAMAVLDGIGTPARAAIVAALDSDALYIRVHARELVEGLVWRGEDVEEPLARALDAPAALDRASAARVIGSLRLKSLALRLHALLADADPDVVRESALALAELGDRSATDALALALERAHYAETRRDIAFALAQLGSTAGMQTLLAGLDHGDDLVRERFFELFFVATGKHEGYDPLAPRPARLAATARLQSWWAEHGGPDALVPPDPERDPIAEAYARDLVSKLGGNDFGPSGSEEDQAMQEELVGMGRYAVTALVRGLKYPAGFSTKRALICKCLGRIGDVRAAPFLAATLRDPVVSVAAWAAWALEGLADRATLPAVAQYEQRIRRLLATDNVPAEAGPGERLLAQAARSRLAAGDDTARHTLATLLLSDDVVTRQLAIGALAQRFGEDHGYDPEADEAERREAAARWMGAEGSAPR